MKHVREQQIAEARQRANEANRRAEIFYRKLCGQSEEEIAAALHMQADVVKEYIQNALEGV